MVFKLHHSILIPRQKHQKKKPCAVFPLVLGVGVEPTYHPGVVNVSVVPAALPVRLP